MIAVFFISLYEINLGFKNNKSVQCSVIPSYVVHIYAFVYRKVFIS